jgi:non-ribosomal peptide synthase protein (TIGR01720 family)
VKVNWTAFYGAEQRRRVPLPTYPFERQRYWIEPSGSTNAVKTRQQPLVKKTDIAGWFYTPLWKQSILLEPGCLVGQGSRWLVFLDTCGLGSLIAERLEQAGQEVIRVTAGDEFRWAGDGPCTINPRARGDYEALLGKLGTLGKTPQEIVHLWSVTPSRPAPSASEFFEVSQNWGFYSLLFLAQMLERQRMADPLHIWAVSSYMQQVAGEEALFPEKATLLGACRVIPQEYPNIVCHSIDVDVPASGGEQERKLIDCLMAELATRPSDPVVVYREGCRWTQTFEAVRLSEGFAGKPRLRERGVYLITGGLGGIGLELADYLARTVQARLILTGRTAFPRRDEWGEWLASHDEQDRVSRKIVRLQAIEGLGAQVLVLGADVASQEQMREVVTQAYERFGELHGVIHAAGIVQEEFLGEVSRAKCEQCFRPKVQGLYVLEEILQGKELDFCVLMSSLASVLGGLGFATYSAANLFMDAFTHQHNRTSPVSWTSVNWDAWRMGGEREIGAVELSITPTEGMQAFERILSMRALTQIAVSTGDLQARIDRWVKLESLYETKREEGGSSALHPRPNLQNAYIAPRDETEQIMADIWQELLGIEQVGVFDNFFELGGDSLLALQVVSRAKQVGLNFTPQQFLQGQTIAELAKAESSTTILAEQGLVTGPMPFTMGQYDFFVNLARDGWNMTISDRFRWNIAELFEVYQDLDQVLIERAVQQLLVHHDALRSRFVREESSWRVFIAEPDKMVPCTRVDLSDLPEAEHKAAIERAADELQDSLNLLEGPLLRVSFFELGCRKPGRLSIILHHLVSDHPSIAILLNDLMTAYVQLSQGKPVRLPAKTTSLKQWAERFSAYCAQSADLRQELDYWRATRWARISRLPADYSARRSDNTIASTRTIRVALGVEETNVLLRDVPTVYDAQIRDMLLMALTQTITQWTGGRWVAVKAANSIRNIAFPGTDEMDLSRTVGNLIIHSTLALEWEGADNPGDALKSIRDQLRRITNWGRGYILLQRLGIEAGKTLVPKIDPDLVFNYLGQTGQSSDGSALFRRAQEFPGQAEDPHNEFWCLLEVVASIEDRLVVSWKYSENLYRSATIEKLAGDFLETLRALIAHCQSQPEHRTTNNLGDSGTIPPRTEQGLVTGPLPLTPGQLWFLEAVRSEPHRFNNNALYKVYQRLDPALVEQTVQHLLVHHDALRSRFVRDESGWRAFIAAPDGIAPVICVDLSALPETVHGAAIDQVGDDLQSSMDLSEGPLLRVGLYDLGADRPERLHITTNHMAIDAYSFSVLLEDLQIAYLQLVRGEQIRLLPKTTSVKRWVERLITYAQSAKMRQELDYWLSLPWSEVHQLPIDYPEGRKNNTVASSCRLEVRLSSAETDVLLRQIPRMYNTQISEVLLMGLVQAVSKWTGRDWVAVKLVDSGRGAIPDADDMDLSRTIGWLAHSGFLLLKREETDNPGDALCSIRDQFRRIPNRGRGFDLLGRYGVDHEFTERLSAMFWVDDLTLNYMGSSTTERAGEESGQMEQVQEVCGNWRNPQTDRADFLYCPVLIAGDQLVMKWEYSENIHKHATIEALANDFIEALRALIAHCDRTASTKVD